SSRRSSTSGTTRSTSPRSAPCRACWPRDASAAPAATASTSRSITSPGPRSRSRPSGSRRARATGPAGSSPIFAITCVSCVAATSAAAYVWAAQVGAARRNGVSDEIIDVLRAKGDPGKLPAEERDIVVYVRQLMRTNRVDQGAFDALAKRHDPKWLVELTAAANYF